MLREIKPANSVQTRCAIQFYGHVRRHAIGLFEALKEKLDPAARQCGCATPHDAGLQLELRDIDAPASRELVVTKNSTNLRFRTFVSVDISEKGHRWYAMDVEPVVEPIPLALQCLEVTKSPIEGDLTSVSASTSKALPVPSSPIYR